MQNFRDVRRKVCNNLSATKALIMVWPLRWRNYIIEKCTNKLNDDPHNHLHPLKGLARVGASTRESPGGVAAHSAKYTKHNEQISLQLATHSTTKHH